MNTSRDPNLQVSVADADARYSASSVGMTTDASVATTDTNPVARDGFEPLAGRHGASTLLPELRNSLRTADEVERSRRSGRSYRAWLVPMILGLGTFLLILGASPLVIWLAWRDDPEPIVAPPPPPDDDLMRIPVRRGLK